MIDVTAIQKQNRERRRRGEPMRLLTTPGGVQYHCSVRLDLDEITKQLKPAQIFALMNGIARVLSANPNR